MANYMYKLNSQNTVLQLISKEECQRLCINDCSNAPQEIICTHRGGKYCTFPSHCEWTKHLCNTGECEFG